MDISNSKVLIVSDAHLTAVGDMTREHKWVDMLIKTSRNYDVVILNGDIFETWKHGMFGWDKKSRGDKLDNILDKLPKLKKFLLKPNVKLIIGNHDMALTLPRFEMYKPIKKLRLKIDDKTVHVEHGNNADANYSFATLENKSFLTVAFDYFSDMLLTFLENKGIIKDKVGLEYGLQNIAYAADLVPKSMFTDYADKLSVEYVVFGHTHTMRYATTDKCEYYNSGSQIFEFEGIAINKGEFKFIQKKYK